VVTVGLTLPDPEHQIDLGRRAEDQRTRHYDFFRQDRSSSSVIGSAAAAPDGGLKTDA
jgi:hypothetical protein